MKWPHEYVLSGSQKERISYDQLSVTQWMAGFCRIMNEEQNAKDKKFTLEYLISLLNNANDFLGMRQRPAMICSYVGWSRGKLSVMNKLKKSTVL